MVMDTHSQHVRSVHKVIKEEIYAHKDLVSV